MCPDPDLLVAYLDGSLASHEAAAIDRHAAGCERCAALLVSMRYQRAIARPVRRRWPRPGVALTVALLAVVGLGAWGLLFGLSGPRDAPAGPPVSALVSEEAQRDGRAEPPGFDGPAEAPPAVAGPEAPPAVTGPEAPEEGGGQEPAPAQPADVPSAPDPSGGGLLLRRGPGARVVLRVRALTIERSTDGGASWEVEYTADRPVRAGTFVSAEVAWLVGQDGLVLRRTPNGWFGTNPPAAGHVVAVRASSASRATVTLADGRVLATDNGGITWFEP